ncbi:MAG: kelch repeat-containing protein [Myxococcales bacterium]|nr:kelch repeat-containing protein [Myxococcales bacterium]
MRPLAALALLACGCGSSGGDGGGSSDLAVVPDFAGATATWQPRAAMPAARQETAVAALDGKVYVLGGFDGTQTIVATVEAWDPATDRWSTMPPLPAPLHHANVATVAGKLYVVGAIKGASFTAIGDSWSFDPAANAWSPRAPMPAGSERGAAMIGVVDHKIYVAGGYRGGAVADFSVYDADADSWSALPALPSVRDHGVGALVGGRFYAIGGRDSTPAAHVARVDAFDLVAGSWSAKTPLPTSRGGAAAGVLDGQIIVAGGEGNAGSPRGVFAAVERYDPAADQWSALPPMRTPRHGTGGAVVGRLFVVPGGADVQLYGAVDVVETITF